MLRLSTCLPLGAACPDLKQPENGYVKVYQKGLERKAEYKCKLGYTLDGVSSRKCLYSGRWSGGSPTCKRKYFK